MARRVTDFGRTGGIGLEQHAAVQGQSVRFVAGTQAILDNVDVEVSGGEFVAVVGASGSGKTTLLHCLSGLIRPTSGRVRIAGRDVGDLSGVELADMRLGEVGFVFQSADLVPELTLRDNIELPLRLKGASRRERRDRVRSLIDTLGLAESADRRPHQVSGGQAQRAAIGRALSAHPSVVFADEPTGALDSENRSIVLDLLVRAARRDGAALVLVTHDPQVAEAADRIVTMVDGRLG